MKYVKDNFAQDEIQPTRIEPNIGKLGNFEMFDFF